MHAVPCAISYPWVTRIAIPVGHLPNGTQGPELPFMDIEKLRVENTRRLIDDRFSGKASHLAAAIGRQSGYLSRVMNGKKGFGEDFARDIERILGLERNYLDREPGDDAALPPEDKRFINEVATGLHDRDIPEHIKQTILTLISSSPEKK